MTAFEDRVRREQVRARWLGSFINAALLFYFFLGLMSILAVPYYSWLVLLMAVAGGAISIFWSRTPASLGPLVFYRTNSVLKNQKIDMPAGFWRTTSGFFVLALLAMTFYLGWNLTEMSFDSLLSSEGLRGAQRILGSLFTPNTDTKIVQMVVEAMVVTIFIALMATVLAIPPAFLFSFLMARNLMRGSPVTIGAYYVLRFIANFTRSVEPLIWAIVFSVWVGIGPFAGMLALMLHSIASLTKLYSEQIENIDRGPLEAIAATGASPIQVVWYAVVPQIVLPYLSFTIYRWDINIRMATIIGLVGGGGVGTLLMQFQGLARWNEVGTVVFIIAAVVWVMDDLSARIREAIY